MATFPSIKPTYGQQKRSAPATRTIRFADGFEHRILFGLAEHQNPKVYNFTFNVSETEADTIETFLDARIADGDYFNWQAPDESTTSKYRALPRKKIINYPNLATIEVTFNEVFEP